MRKVREALEPEVRQAAHCAIDEALETLHRARPGLVAVYAPSSFEASPLGFVASLEARSERVAWPRVDGARLRFHVCAQSELAPGFAGLLEPPTMALEVDIRDIAMLLVPGLAFDERGHRLGQGGGFYDRLMASIGALRVGICYAAQRVERVPTLLHDVAVDVVVSG